MDGEFANSLLAEAARHPVLSDRLSCFQTGYRVVGQDGRIAEGRMWCVIGYSALEPHALFWSGRSCFQTGYRVARQASSTPSGRPGFGRGNRVLGQDTVFPNGRCSFPATGKSRAAEQHVACRRTGRTVSTDRKRAIFPSCLAGLEGLN